MEQRRREAIGELVRAGQSAKDIISLTGYAKSTVYRTIATVGAGGDVAQRSHTPRNDRKRTPIFLKQLETLDTGETEDFDEQACACSSREQARAPSAEP